MKVASALTAKTGISTVSKTTSTPDSPFLRHHVRTKAAARRRLHAVRARARALVSPAARRRPPT
jgi:hypothetical protein